MYTRLDTHRWQYISLAQNKIVEVSVDEFGFVNDEPGTFSRAD